MKYELEQFRRDIPDEELLADLRRVGQELGKNRGTFTETLPLPALPELLAS